MGRVKWSRGVNQSSTCCWRETFALEPNTHRARAHCCFPHWLVIQLSDYFLAGCNRDISDEKLGPAPPPFLSRMLYGDVPTVVGDSSSWDIVQEQRMRIAWFLSVQCRWVDLGPINSLRSLRFLIVWLLPQLTLLFLYSTHFFPYLWAYFQYTLDLGMRVFELCVAGDNRLCSLFEQDNGSLKALTLLLNEVYPNPVI